MANLAKKRDWLRNERNDTQLPVGHRLAGNLSSHPLSYFGPLSNFFSDMDRVFDHTFRHFGMPSLANMQNLALQTFTPKVDITSNDHEYTVSCEVPGLDEKDVRVDVSPDGTLSITGEKRLESVDSRKDTYCTECSYGAFERTLSLPEDVDPENIQARFKNGVLTITCARTESARQPRREIPIGSHKVAEAGRSNYSSGSERAANQPQKKTA